MSRKTEPEPEPEPDTPPPDDGDEEYCLPNDEMMNHRPGNSPCGGEDPHKVDDGDEVFDKPLDCNHPQVTCSDENLIEDSKEPRFPPVREQQLDCSHPQVTCLDDQNLVTKDPNQSRLAFVKPQNVNGLDCNDPKVTCDPEIWQSNTCEDETTGLFTGSDKRNVCYTDPITMKTECQKTIPENIRYPWFGNLLKDHC